jgi:ABC-2 type transport system ATP-binding protein
VTSAPPATGQTLDSNMPAEPSASIDAIDVSRRFGRRVAVARASLRVAAGELVGLVGPNGAGKSTLLRILAGYLEADAGVVRIAGHDLADDRRAAQARLGYLAETSPLPPEMGVAEYLCFRAALKGVARRRRGEAVAVAAERAGVAAVPRRLLGTLSKGFRQRVGLADALLGDPPVLLLDEPASGLDPMQTRELRGLLAELAGTRAILLSTHDLGELEGLAGRVVVIAGGRVVADEAPAALCARLGVARLEDAVVALCGGAAT